MNTIDPRIHQVLDGELPAEALPEELRRVAAQIAAAADLLAAPPAQAGASLESRVMARIRRPPPSRVRRMPDWRVTPHALVPPFRPARQSGPDHLAQRLVADDFGRENSVVIVRAARR